MTASTINRVLTGLIFILWAFKSNAQPYESKNINKYGIFQDSALNKKTNLLDNRYNSVWAYFDSIQNKEYAILGGMDGTYLIEVTQPEKPVLRDYVKGKRGNCIWREYKNYKQFLYAISDDDNPNSLQIIDLSTLPDSAQVVYDSNGIFSRAHTLFIDGKNMYCASVKTNQNTFYSMAVYSLENPKLPQLIATLNTDYPNIGQVHDMFVRNDTIYASCGFEGLYVFKFQENKHFKLLGQLTEYPDRGYNHSSSITSDGKTMVFTDEVPEGLSVKIADISDLSDIKIKSTFITNLKSTAHNPHILNNKVVISYYMDGVQIFDISNSEKPVLSGFFDTYPQNGNTYTTGFDAYKGCWGVCPYLPSGTLLASDMQSGLFVLDAKAAYNLSTNMSNYSNLKNTFTLSPNPFNNEININFEKLEEDEMVLEIADVLGHVIYKDNNLEKNETRRKIQTNSNLKAGIYFVTLKGNNFSTTKKIIKQ